MANSSLDARNLISRVSHLTVLLARPRGGGGGKMRDPRNEVGVHDLLQLLPIVQDGKKMAWPRTRTWTPYSGCIQVLPFVSL